MPTLRDEAEMYAQNMIDNMDKNISTEDDKNLLDAFIMISDITDLQKRILRKINGSIKEHALSIQEVVEEYGIYESEIMRELQDGKAKLKNLLAKNLYEAHVYTLSA